MRRNAAYLSVSILTILTVTGCTASGRKNVDTEPAATTADVYTPPVQESAYESDPYPTYGSPMPIEDTYEAAAPVITPEPRYHTVMKKDTLYGLARMYYSDPSRWKDIYEANRSVISDPDRIRIGQRLMVP
ncbi:MAG: LysM peptidoglycan-binding domain-containing protein, partial [Phycisphaerae bacterium]